MAKIALITGITGQDGSYLAEFLLDEGYDVHGVVRRSSSENLDRISHLLDRVNLHDADLIDPFSLSRLLQKIKPQEVYNLAAQSFVPPRLRAPVRKRSRKTGWPGSSRRTLAWSSCPGWLRGSSGRGGCRPSTTPGRRLNLRYPVPVPAL